ncbi:MAG: DNA-binding NtrC family response regulator [Myxococcota bacterium]
MAAQDWPGNIRQLGNAVRRAAVFAAGEGAEWVRLHHFQDGMSDTNSETLSYGNPTRGFQHELLPDALEAAEGNVSQVSHRLGFAKSHVYSLLKEHGLRF